TTPYPIAVPLTVCANDTLSTAARARTIAVSPTAIRALRVEVRPAQSVTRNGTIIDSGSAISGAVTANSPVSGSRRPTLPTRVIVALQRVSFDIAATRKRTASPGFASIGVTGTLRIGGVGDFDDDSAVTTICTGALVDAPFVSAAMNVRSTMRSASMPQLSTGVYVTSPVAVSRN